MESYKKLSKLQIDDIMENIPRKIYVNEKTYKEQFKQLKIDKIYYPYIISSFGRVFSLNYKMQKGNLQELKTTTDKDGYQLTHINFMGVKKLYRIHRLVALNFIKNKKHKEQVNHKDGNKMNNTIYNLEWSTCQENIDHAHKTGLSNGVGVLNNANKYSEKQIHDVCKLISENKYSLMEISKITNVSYYTVTSILYKKTWTFISDRYYFGNYTHGKDLSIVHEICKIAEENDMYTISEISRLTGVNKYTVSDILHGKTHKDITKNYNLKKYQIKS